MKTYFILGRKDDRTPSYSGSFRAEGRQKYTNALQLFVSPPTSSPILSPQSRPRVLSCNPSTKSTIQNCNLLSPDVCKIKANSLPSILDIENEQDNNGGVDIVVATSTTDGVDDIAENETPTSSTSSSKLKRIKFPKFKRKTSNNHRHSTELEPSEMITISLECSDDGYQQVPTIIQANPNNTTNNNDQQLIDSIMEFSNNDSIDIKSYISQSRCDISPYDYSSGTEFIRSGSYRSKYSRSPNDLYLQRANSNRSKRGRSPNSEIFEPTERSRSATVAIGSLNRPKKSLDAINQIHNVSLLDDQSINNSRKDSGIKSNSRRSSIQQVKLSNI